MSVPELGIVEAIEEYMSLTNSYSSHYSLTDDKHFTMLQNTCIRYDKSLKQNPYPQPGQSINMSLMRTQAQMVMKEVMLKNVVHLMELTLHLMTSTMSTAPISTGMLRSSP